MLKLFGTAELSGLLTGSSGEIAHHRHLSCSCNIHVAAFSSFYGPLSKATGNTIISEGFCLHMRTAIQKEGRAWVLAVNAAVVHFLSFVIFQIGSCIFLKMFLFVCFGGTGV
jgi:hypothetical protein